MNEQLLGIWISDPSDSFTQRAYGNVAIEFFDDGRLVYTINEGNKTQQIIMTYHVDGNQLITDQASMPKEERTPFVVTDHHLELNYDGSTARFVRFKVGK